MAAKFAVFWFEAWCKQAELSTVYIRLNNNVALTVFIMHTLTFIIETQWFIMYKLYYTHFMAKGSISCTSSASYCQWHARC